MRLNRHPDYDWRRSGREFAIVTFDSGSTDKFSPLLVADQASGSSRQTHIRSVVCKMAQAD